MHRRLGLVWLVLVSGCSDSNRQAAEPLLDWAEQITRELKTRELHDWVESSFAAASDGQCPSQEATVGPLPQWYPPSVSASPDLVTAYPRDPAEDLVQTLALGGGCSSDVADWQGLGTDVYFSIGSCPASASCGHHAEWWEGSSLSATEPSAGAAQPWSLTIDGRLYAIVDSWGWPNDCANQGWERASYRGGTATIRLASAPDAPALINVGTTELDWTWDTLNRPHPYEVGCEPGDRFNLAATVTWFAETRPRRFVADLHWDYADRTPDGAGGFLGPEGCELEPLSGTVTVTEAPAPQAAPTTTLVAAFDGAVRCDGCADLTLNGQPMEPWCPPTGFFVP